MRIFKTLGRFWGVLVSGFDNDSKRTHNSKRTASRSPPLLPSYNNLQSILNLQWVRMYQSQAITTTSLHHHHFRCSFISDYILLILILFNSINTITSTGGRFSLRLNYFNNPLGVLESSSCCKSNCTSPCSTRFRICVKNYQVSIDSNGPCYIGEAQSIPIHSNTVNELQWDFEFKFRWTGTFSLIIEAWNVIDNAYQQNTGLIARMAIQQWLSIDPKWHNRTYVTPLNHTFNYSYRVVCLNHYYGDECNRYCKSRDDKFGHYNCSENGDILCYQGWSGEYCMEATCNPSCLHGTCTAPNYCTCKLGYTGSQCSQCHTYPGCKHGSCTVPWQCECEEGWGGLFCNQDLNYCTNHKPCKHDGVCFNTGQGSYTCNCTGGWTGIDCSGESNGRESCPDGNCILTSEDDKRICGENFNCLNGGTCNSGLCLCPSHTLPPDCRLPFCISSPCPDGSTCSESSRSCICPLGIVGPHCSSSGGPLTCQCKNNGTCTKIGSCICQPEWSGRDCSIPNEAYTLTLVKEVKSELSAEYAVLVILVAVITPLTALCAVSLIWLYKRRRDRERRREDEIVRLQNDENDGKLVVVNKFKESNLWKNSDPDKMRCPSSISGGHGVTNGFVSCSEHSPSGSIPGPTPTSSLTHHHHHTYCNNYVDPGSTSSTTTTTPYVLPRSNSHDLFKSTHLNNLSLANLNMTQV